MIDGNALEVQSASFAGGILQVLKKNLRLRNSVHATERITVTSCIQTHAFSLKSQQCSFH